MGDGVSFHNLKQSARTLQVIGQVRPEIAQQLGLAEGVAVAPGSGDNQMSALGAGAVQEGAWVVSLGTSGAHELPCRPAFMH